MSDRFEQSIKNWYQNSRTVNLEYLDLETKESLKGISNNISVIYDRLLLHSKVSITEYKSLIETLKQNHLEITQTLQESLKEYKKLQQAILQLQKEFLYYKPLTIGDIRSLVEEISKQPKLIEEQATSLIAELKQQIKHVEVLMQEVKRQVS